LGVLVLAKGGHLGGTAAPDALVDASGRVDETRRSGAGGSAAGKSAPRIIEFLGERIETTNTHGTGCSLSSAIATLRADLGSWEAAVIEARRWLRESITHGASLEVGEGHGPISHFAGLWERGGLSTAPSPEEIESDWWAGIADVRDAIDELGFVRGLADGSLDRAPFVRYLAQDARYLRDYSRVLAVASSSATDAAEQAFWAASARGAIIGELELHASWLPEGEAFAAEPDAATTGYLNHLLATAARGDYPVLAAALLPCFWIYVDLGERLAAGAFGPQALAPGHPYASWLTTYADPAFAVATCEAIGIVTRLAATADAPTRQAMWRAFRASSEHELAFFASPLGELDARDPALAHTANPQLRGGIRGTVHEPAVFS
ncbi:bifunctional hydroxymethylpyrimidine kinase/phosphomethylpyrimidine kinase, partial [Agromyces albus]